MDINEVRDIMDIASKLEVGFRHIKYLCGKYQEMEKDGNLSNESYNTYPFIPQHYGPPPPYPHDPSYYQAPYNPNYGYPPHPMTQHYPPNTFPIKNVSQMNIPQKTNKIPAKQTKAQKTIAQQKKSQLSNVSTYHQPKNKTQQNDQKSEQKPYPESPYHVFLKSKKTQIKNQYPHLKEQQLLEIMMQVWKSFNEKQKKPYQLEFKRLQYNYLAKAKEQKSQQKIDYSEMAKNLKSDMMKKTQNQ